VPEHDALYVGYTDGTIQVVALDVPNPAPEASANIGANPGSILGVREALLVSNGATYRFFSDEGTLLATTSGSGLTNPIWDAVGSRLLYFSSSTSTSLQARGVLPDYTLEPEQFLSNTPAPIRASADGGGL